MTFGKINWYVVLFVAGLAAGLLLCVVYQSKKDDRKIAAYIYGRDYMLGEIVVGADLIEISIPATTAERIGKLITEEYRNRLAAECLVRTRVSRGDFVKTEHFIPRHGCEGYPILPSAVAVTITVDPGKMPDKPLRIGDRVNVLGDVSVKGSRSKYKEFRIVECAMVLAIGGPVDATTATRPCNTIIVEVSQEGLDTSQWRNLAPYLKGRLTVEICPDMGRINPKLLHMIEQSADDVGP